MSIPVDPTEEFNPRIKRGTHIIAQPLNIFKLMKRLESLPQNMIPKIVTDDGTEYCFDAVIYDDENCVSLKLIKLRPEDECLR